MADLVLDFLLTPTYDSKLMAVTDISTYPTEPADPEAPTLTVSVPGFYTVTIPFVPEEMNVLNSTILGITDTGADPLPDGVYVIRYSVSPAATSYIEKTVMRVDQLQEKFDNAFMKLDMMQCDASLKKQQKVSLDTIYYFIQGAIAAANNCATDEAVRLYQKADKLLYNFISKGECSSITFPSQFY